MASVAINIVDYAVQLIWTCLCLANAAQKNPMFAIVLPSQDVVKQLLLDSYLAFAPGLLDVLQAKTPPPLSYFKSLPTNVKKRWGVYVVVLEKAGCRPRIYVGSGTDSNNGIAQRFNDYNAERNLPRFVKQALHDGYTIVHQGLLCWSPLPIPTKVFALRTLFLAIETTFSVVFWALYSRTKDYGMPNICPWSLDALEYDGCCTHIAFTEGIAGEDFGATVEQIAAKQVEMKEKTRQLQAAVTKRGRNDNRDSRRYACDLCNSAFRSQSDLNLHYVTKKHINKANGVNKVVKDPRHKAWTAANLAARKYYCEICDVVASAPSKLDIHFKTKRHIDKAAEAAKSSS
jgi:Zinc-finger of C2H2 type